jgi:hypothetical protein
VILLMLCVLTSEPMVAAASCLVSFAAWTGSSLSGFLVVRHPQWPVLSGRPTGGLPQHGWYNCPGGVNARWFDSPRRAGKSMTLPRELVLPTQEEKTIASVRSQHEMGVSSPRGCPMDRKDETISQ